MAYIQIFGIFVMWLLIIPMCIGALLAGIIEKKKITLGTMYYSGGIFMLAIFQCIAVPMIVQKLKFNRLVGAYNIVIVIIAVIGAVLFIINLGRKGLDEYLLLPDVTCRKDKKQVTVWIIFALLLISQLVMSLCYMTPDGDDAYYLTEAVIAVKKGFMYTENPYVGSATALDYRHVLAPFSMFIAFLSEHSGVHGVIVAHSILPLMLIPLTYLIFYKIGCVLFRDELEKVGVFMVVIAGLQIFGASSLYTNEKFFLTRTWQGKSVLANIIIPLAIYLCLLLAEKTEIEEFRIKGGKYDLEYSVVGIFIMLFLVNLAGALASSLGLLLLSIMEGVFLFIISIRNKKIWILPVGVLSMIPCGIFMSLYVVL